MSRNYHQQSLWQQHYKQNVCQWYQYLATPNQLIPILTPYLNVQASPKVLQLGCGSSNLAQKLQSLGLRDITCVDFSKEVIKHKSKGAKEGISYKHHNILQKLPFQDDSFDIIIEKNTLDCLFCIPDYPRQVLPCMAECFRVLKEGGKMISISNGMQKHRRFFYRTKFSPFQYECVLFQEKKDNQPLVNVYVLSKGEGQEQENPNIGQIIRQEGSQEEGDQVRQEGQPQVQDQQQKEEQQQAKNNEEQQGGQQQQKAQGNQQQDQNQQNNQQNGQPQANNQQQNYDQEFAQESP